MAFGANEFSIEMFEIVYCQLEGYFGPRILQDIFSEPPMSWDVTPDSEPEMSHERRNRLAYEIYFTWKNTLPPEDVSSWTLRQYNFASQYLIPHMLVDSFTVASMSMFHSRRIATFGDGKLALVPVSAREGDIICCLAGSPIPYVLRRHETFDSISDNTVYESFTYQLPPPRPILQIPTPSPTHRRLADLQSTVCASSSMKKQAMQFIGMLKVRSLYVVRCADRD